MGQFLQDEENGQNVAFFFSFFGALIWQLLSTVLKRFCPLDSKTVFVLALAHLEPELELFEVVDIGDDDADDL